MVIVYDVWLFVGGKRLEILVGPATCPGDSADKVPTERIKDKVIRLWTTTSNSI